MACLKAIKEDDIVKGVQKPMGCVHPPLYTKICPVPCSSSPTRSVAFWCALHCLDNTLDVVWCDDLITYVSPSHSLQTEVVLIPIHTNRAYVRRRSQCDCNPYIVAMVPLPTTTTTLGTMIRISKLAHRESVYNSVGFLANTSHA